MRKIVLIATVLLFGGQVFAQLTANGNSGSTTTAYTNGSPNNPVFIWCSDVLSTAQGSLTATPTVGVGPYTFDWFFHDQNTSSWAPFTTQSGATSTINNLASDGYRVQIKDAGNNVVECLVAWVWNLNTQVVAASSTANCTQSSLNGTVNTTGTFTYYNPPPPQSLINASTSIQVCFNATHTWVSDLGFFIVAPGGSPTVALSQNPGALGQGSICNSGDNVNNLCFSTSSISNLDVCANVPSTLSGTYGTYGPSPGIPINWGALIGANAASAGWKVQIYDCIGGDVGALTGASFTFSNLTSVCGSPTSISYSSGAINSIINDGSCTAATASVFQVLDPLSAPLVLNASTTLLWTSNPAVAITNSTNASASAVVSSPSTTNFILTATTSFGAVSCSSDDTTTVTIVQPIVGAGQDQTICQGSNATLNGSGAVTYVWDNGVTNGTPFVVNGTQTYTVTGTDANGCTNTDNVLITASPAPTIGAGQDQAICAGSSVTLSGSGGVSYIWNNGVTNGVAFSPAATQVYTVTGTDATGCTNTDQVTVTVNPSPTINAGIDQAVCPGTSVILSGSGGVSYTWNNGVTNGVPFTPTSTATYTVTGTSANGCTNTDQVVVTIKPLPAINGGVDQAFCIGGSATLTASGGVNYSWSNGVTNGVAFNPTTTQTYTVTGVGSNGCINTDQVLVTVNQLPNIGAGTDQTICLGTAIQLNGTGGTTYVWNNGVTNGNSITPGLGSNTYIVTGTNANGCVNKDTVVVTVVPVPTAVISSTGALTGYPGLTVNFTNSSTNATSYVFDYNNGFTTSTGNINTVGTSTFTAPGVYLVTLTASNGICDDEDNITVIVIPFEPLVYEMPNVFTPNGDNLNDNFEVSITNVVEFNVKIVNRWGGFMYEMTSPTDKWDGKVNGNPADNGVYFYTYKFKGKDGVEIEGQGFVELFR